MSNPISERVNTTEIDDETRDSNEKELTHVNYAGSSQNTPVTSEGKARQTRAVTDSLSKQLKLLYNLMKKPDIPLSEVAKRLVV